MALPIPKVVVSPDEMPRTKFGAPPLLNLVSTWSVELPPEPPDTKPGGDDYREGDHTAVTHILYRIISSNVDTPTRNGEPETATNQALNAENVFYLFGALSEPEWSLDSVWSEFVKFDENGSDTISSRWSTLSAMAPPGSAEDSEWSEPIVEAILPTAPTTNSEWADLQMPVSELFPDNITDLDDRDQALQLRDVLEQRNDGIESMRLAPPEWHSLPSSVGSYSDLRYFDLVFELGMLEIRVGRHQSMFDGMMNPSTSNLNPTERCYWVMAVLGVDDNDILRGYNATP